MYRSNWQLPTAVQTEDKPVLKGEKQLHKVQIHFPHIKGSTQTCNLFQRTAVTSHIA
jgi:hypothetical protein